MSGKGFSSIELVVTILVVLIIASLTAGIIASLMQLFVYLPREMKARTVAHEAIEFMTEGEIGKRGMRFAVQVLDASPIQITYTFGYPGNEDKRNMRFRWDSTTNKIYRSYTAFGDAILGPEPPYSLEEIIPYYAGPDISIRSRQAAPNTIFTYFKQDGSAWAEGVDALSEIRRVEINIVVSTGTGLFTNWESSFETTSSVEVKQYL